MYRCIDTCAITFPGAVHIAITDRIQTLMRLNGLGLCVEYIQSLMEHYPPGLEALMSELPQGQSYSQLALAVLSRMYYSATVSCG